MSCLFFLYLIIPTHLHIHSSGSYLSCTSNIVSLQDMKIDYRWELVAMAVLKKVRDMIAPITAPDLLALADHIAA